ncbi:Ig-like domain-containing protein [Chryseobacterium gossypii]|uniref:Ig-like domain-containing protein n=1 Tax=Chryseobacterium gossypii TaxID=3231602 RepID=UPI003526BAF1
MKTIFILLAAIPSAMFGQQIITDDLHNFWNAYDQIIAEKDSSKHLNLIKTLYINKGTPGLHGIMKARKYSAEEYVYAITHYPEFWKSIRKNTLKSDQFSEQIREGIKKLKNLYPNLKPVNTYFEIGILRTGGTTIDGMLLIGSEVALADKTVVTNEFDRKYPHLRSYFDTEPIKDIVFLNTHEYIHTQQKASSGHSLLAQTMIEGVAEFLAEIALDKKSPNPQIYFGYKHEERIRSAYEKEMFSPYISNWIWNNTDNQFGMRDLGYFVGYAICKKYYEGSTDKKLAVKEMIELDYNNEDDLVAFVDRSKYFSRPLSVYKEEFERLRPKVIGIRQFKNESRNVSPGTKIITLLFSQPMDKNTRGFDYGPPGEKNALKVQKVIGFSEDGKAFSFEVALEPGTQYQSVATENFRDRNDLPLQPFLISFQTSVNSR